jgi:hypothetical protein
MKDMNSAISDPVSNGTDQTPVILVGHVPNLFLSLMFLLSKFRNSVIPSIC